ncbi:MAG TPA: VOC family protein [Acidimicrobiales bacterium]|jgi:catechol 2,3-dioxygenase-like lactoylglutathione lyase family enzyme|nr:VOC family protein [Acidimicrobiales bacterium]
MGTNTRITGLHTVGVPVSDQDQALAFYAGTLGLEIRLDVRTGAGARWIEVAPAGGGVSLALERAHDARPTGVETGIRLTSADIDATHAALRALGVDADDVLRWPGVPAMFALRDQDGNGLEIVEA